MSRCAFLTQIHWMSVASTAQTYTREDDMAKLLITTRTGPSDPTGASVPLHIALNGAVKSGVEVAVAFAGDAAEVLKPDVYKNVRGVGIPAMADLMDGLAANKVHFYV